MIHEQDQGSIGQILQGSAKLAQEGYFKDLLLYEDTFLGVINDQRQFLLVNQAFLLEHRSEIQGQKLGLRPGDVLSCQNSLQSNRGCGTHSNCLKCEFVNLFQKVKNSKKPAEGSMQMQVILQGGQTLETYQGRIEPRALDDSWVYLVYLFRH
jgi:hypothetical protein